MLVIIVANICALFLYLRWRNSSKQPTENETFIRISCFECFLQLLSSAVGVSYNIIVYTDFVTYTKSFQIFALLLIVYPGNELLVILEILFTQIVQYSLLFRTLGILLFTPALRAEFLRHRRQMATTESFDIKTQEQKLFQTAIKR